jgi:uncharacterized membrane protein YedE/YeeE
VHFFAVRRAKLAEAPRFAPAFAWPDAVKVDPRLVLGAALFGAGWGIAGFCPGPAVVSLVALAPSTLAFVAAMLAGMGLHTLSSR